MNPAQIPRKTGCPASIQQDSLPPTKLSLSPARQRLVETMQYINFGRIDLEIRAGEPVFHPTPKITREIKIGVGAENGPRPELARDDFTLKAQVVELFDHLSRVPDGTIVTLQVQSGLPCRLQLINQPA